MASSLRCLPPPIATDRSPSSTSSGPRTRSSLSRRKPTLPRDSPRSLPVSYRPLPDPGRPSGRSSRTPTGRLRPEKREEPMITIRQGRGNAARGVAIGIIVAGLLGLAVPAGADTTHGVDRETLYLQTPSGVPEYPNPHYPNHKPL